MGQKNAVTKRFCSDKIRFADLINGVYFQGREIIHSKDLTASSEGYAEPWEHNSARKNRDYLERTRDIKMRHQSGTSIRILAIENQHYVDYSMPFRNMQYDALEYQHQLDEINVEMQQRALFSPLMNDYARLKKLTGYGLFTPSVYIWERNPGMVLEVLRI